MEKRKSGILLRTITLVLCVLFSLLRVSEIQALEVTVDEFSTDQATLTLTHPGDTGTSTGSVISGGAILGGERDIQIALTAGVINGNGISAGVTSDNFSYSQGPTINASAMIQWDGADGDPVALNTTGLGGLDLTAGNSQDAFVIGVSFDDNPIDIVLDVYTDAGNVSQYTLNLPGGIFLPIEYVIPFSDFVISAGTGADFSNVGAVVLSMTSVTAPDLVLDFVRTTSVLHASKSDALLLDNNSDGQANPGETLEYTVVISNAVDSVAATATNVFFNDTPDANTALVVGSVTTSQGVVTSGNTGGDTTVAVDIGDIVDADIVTITFQVTVDNPLVGCVAQVSNQGSVTYDPAITIPTDDPDTPAVDDATATPTFCLYDLGDAPDPSYPTLLSSMGAQHVIGSGVYLGACVDGEVDGQPSAASDGDDGNLGSPIYGTCVGNDDEDGVTFPAPLLAGATVAVDVVANAPCDLSAWIDFNADGDWGDAGELIFSGEALAVGTNNLNFAIPATAVLGTTFARFRCTTDGAVSFTGQASDGEVEDYPVTIAAAYSLGDFVWYDTDQDGIQDAAEPGVNNISVDLYDNGTCTAPVFANDSTDASGAYGFSGLPAGTYCLQFSSIPAGWTISPQDQGADDTVDSDANPATGQITNIVLSADDPDEDMGVYAQGSLGDTVWCDANANSLYDVGEGIAGVTISLYEDTNCDDAPDGAAIATQDTVGDGQYLFSSLPVGPPGGPAICYYVAVDVADMGACNTPITPVFYSPDLDATTPNDLSADFGFNQAVALASIGDFVWRDNNQDGIQDEVGTGITGVTVNLYQCAAPSTLYSTTISTAGGAYGFIDLTPGDYFVECVLPSGYSFSPQDQGADDALDSDADTATGRTVCTTLDPGENDPTWDCGMFVAGPAIEVVKEVSHNGWVAPNVPRVVYTLTVTNIGDTTLNPVSLDDTLDPGLSFIPGSAIPTESSVTGQIITWNDITAGAGLAPAASMQVVFDVSGPTLPGLYVNSALVEGMPPTGGTITDTDSIDLLVEDPSVSIVKTLYPPGVVGDMVTFTIYIENTGPSAIDVLPLYDTFSGPAIYVGGDPIADSIDNVNQQLLWNDLTVPFGQDLYPGQAFYIVTVFQMTNFITYTMINTAEIPPGGTDVYTNPINQPRSETAAEIIDLQALQQGQRVRLSWQTASELDTYGYRILRDDGGALSNPVELTFVSSQVQGSLGGASYEYWDDTVTAGHTYTYWLMDVDLSGVEVANGPVVVNVNASRPVYLPILIKH